MKNLVMLFALIALSAVFLLFWDSPPEFFFGTGRTQVEALPTADSYMHNPVTTQYNADGVETYTLGARTGLYYNRDDRFEVEAPHLTARRDASDDTPWQLRAREAHTLDGGQQVVLSGEVHAWNDGPRGKSTFDTEELRFNPDDNSAETDRKVTIHYPGGYSTGVGMRADFGAETYQLLNQVQGRHHGR
ncbi:MAG: LPS export ABC transporter periplasmic protein LptC [Porticoccaceae bacterium]|jgi:LPS export ABC transporter protein LptC|nr:LPS export ABC transporter periplasmic protein LptC [Porticoccaceae bacterium]MEA3300686.1 LPS export ABC transporter periplasmic protein LptC [Pseudomonadota bacterium]HLS98699.1 LPS export ABC transporter periplasmic protein LptC [Porticoccaceae bacterium]